MNDPVYHSDEQGSPNSQLEPDRLVAMLKAECGSRVSPALTIHDARFDVASLECLLPHKSEMQRLEALSIRGCVIGPQHAEVLSALLSTCHNLRRLTLSQSQLADDVCADIVSNGFASDNLQLLSLQGNAIGTRSVASMLAAHDRLRNVLTLDLSGNNIDTTSIEALVSCRKLVASLRTLRLNGNCITGDAGGCIASLLASHSNDVLLDLSTNPFGDTGISRLVSGGIRLPRLVRLLLNNCGVGDDGAVVLSKSAGLLPRLKFLEIEANRMTDLGVGSIRRARSLPPWRDCLEDLSDDGNPATFWGVAAGPSSAGIVLRSPVTVANDSGTISVESHLQTDEAKAAAPRRDVDPEPARTRTDDAAASSLQTKPSGNDSRVGNDVAEEPQDLGQAASLLGLKHNLGKAGWARLQAVKEYLRGIGRWTWDMELPLAELWYSCDQATNPREVKQVPIFRAVSAIAVSDGETMPPEPARVSRRWRESIEYRIEVVQIWKLVQPEGTTLAEALASSKFVTELTIRVAAFARDPDTVVSMTLARLDDPKVGGRFDPSKGDPLAFALGIARRVRGMIECQPSAGIWTDPAINETRTDDGAGRDPAPSCRAAVACAMAPLVGRKQRVINIHTERLIAIREVPERLPRRPDGRHIHLSACYRWIKLGIRGILLEAVKIGGVTYTSLEALQRFAERNCTEQRTAHSPSPATLRKGRDEILARRVAIALGVPMPEQRRQ